MKIESMALERRSGIRKKLDWRGERGKAMKKQGQGSQMRLMVSSARCSDATMYVYQPKFVHTILIRKTLLEHLLCLSLSN